jgi:hypothetical protein
MPTKALNLFDAYAQSALPDNGGFIVSTFLDPTSAYARYEVVAYGGVKNIVLTEEGLTFQADGNKVFVLCEPPAYIEKHVEPYSRDKRHAIPHRYSELETITAKNQTKIMVSKEPVLTYSSFTVLRPTGNDFAVLFYNLPDVLASIEQFLGVTLNKEAAIPQADAKKAAQLVMKVVKQFTIFG